VGSITVKHFEIALTEGDPASRQQVYGYPSPADCLACHTQAGGRALGLRTRQLNGDFDYGAVTDNQLRSLANVGYFDVAIGDAAAYESYAPPDAGTADLDGAARAYLAVNCAQCHQPAGTAPVTLDLRYDTPLADSNAVSVAPAAGALGIADARIIVPGDRTRSVLWERMRRLDGDRMPPVGSHRVDAEGVELIGRWIDAL